MIKKHEEIWKSAKWLEQGRLLISGFEDFPLDLSIGLILRHSKRNEPSLWDENQNMELTEEGMEIARLFGTKLPETKRIILFHSGVNRCRETAEKIHDGFTEIGGKSTLKGECSILRGIGLDPKVFIEELKKYSLINVIKRWINGLYPEDKWPSFTSYCKRAANIIWPFIEKQKKNIITIFVTHDLHSIILRYGWFGFQLDMRGINYLGGFAFIFDRDSLKVLDYGMVKTAKFPYYWKQ